MGTNKAGKCGAHSALDAVSRKAAEKVAPKLERLRAAKGQARAKREDVAAPNESVEELAEEVTKVKRAVKAARKRRAPTGRGGETLMPVRLIFGWAFAVASLAVGVHAAVRQKAARLKAIRAGSRWALLMSPLQCSPDSIKHVR